MKNYTQLTEEEQQAAIEKCVKNIWLEIVEMGRQFNETNPDLQARIDKAVEKAEQMQTPWFCFSYVMDTCSDDFYQMAEEEAKNALYSEPGEYVIAGIA